MGGTGTVVEKKAKKDELESEISKIRQIPASQSYFVEEKAHLREEITRVTGEKTVAERKESAEDEKAALLKPRGSERQWKKPESALALEDEESRMNARTFDTPEEVEAEEIHIQTKAVELMEREIGERAREEERSPQGAASARKLQTAKRGPVERERIRIRRPEMLSPAQTKAANDLRVRDLLVRNIVLRSRTPSAALGPLRRPPAIGDVTGSIDQLVSGMLKKGRK